MSAFKQMPNPERIRFKRCLLFISILIVAGVLGYLQKTGQLNNTPFCVFLFIALLVLIVVGTLMGCVGRCPDCGRFMDEIYEDSHPKAADIHLLYCEHCDVIWDTTIPKAHG